MMNHRKYLLLAIAILGLSGPASAGTISPYLFFNRCVGGCTVKGGSTDDARAGQSTLPCTAPTCVNGSCNCPGGSSGSYTVHEFQNQFGDIGSAGHCYGDNGATACTLNAQCSGTCTGAGSTCAGGTKAGANCTADTDCADTCDTADYEWGAIMQCLKEVYSPFAVTVSDVKPSGGVSYTMDYVAGAPADIGYGATQTGGIAPGGCIAKDNVVSFSFANLPWGRGQQRILTLCGVAAQETAHAFGLEHEYEFADGPQMSACNSPMTYRTDCGGEQFFRNHLAKCGEDAVRDCYCGGLQNSHTHLIDVFGPGTSLIPPPTASVTLPADGGSVTNGWATIVSAGSRRGVDRIELWFNGYLWSTKPGAQFGADGQQDPSTYSIPAPSGVPDGGIKIVVKALDDIGGEDDVTLSVTKGALCTDATSCLNGQKCNTGAATDTVAAGGCYWEPASGAVGDACTFPQFCVSGICQGAAGGDQTCTQHCVPGVGDSCPANFECDPASDGQAYCFKKTADSGCCSTSGGAPWSSFALGMGVLAMLARRRRK
jgi:MYXO-CTERM domain-containing protein